MTEVLFETIVRQNPGLQQVAADAALQRLKIGRILGAGGYGAAFEVHSARFGDCVLKIAGVDFVDGEIQQGESGLYRAAASGDLFHIGSASATGPLLPCAPGDLEHCLANLNNGRFACGDFHLPQILDRMRDGTADLPSAIQSWILDIGAAMLEVATNSTADPIQDPSWPHKQLQRLASTLPG